MNRSLSLILTSIAMVAFSSVASANQHESAYDGWDAKATFERTVTNSDGVRILHEVCTTVAYKNGKVTKSCVTH